MLARSDLLARIRRALARSPTVALVGPRQVGKTTLARTLLAPAADLALDFLYVVYPGDRRCMLGERIEAVPLGTIAPPRAAPAA